MSIFIFCFCCLSVPLLLFIYVHQLKRKLRPGILFQGQGARSYLQHLDGPGKDFQRDGVTRAIIFSDTGVQSQYGEQRKSFSQGPFEGEIIDGKASGDHIAVQSDSEVRRVSMLTTNIYLSGCIRICSRHQSSRIFEWNRWLSILLYLEKLGNWKADSIEQRGGKEEREIKRCRDG